ncbi:hypothetical protein ACIRQP_14735 [Streptomyces sp. NPDC102274]|uniref:hypothetical protein n=1 Tax=Streptomyces sp. NPDC102274 TaxID=3366151 RepID=UPI003829A8E1
MAHAESAGWVSDSASMAARKAVRDWLAVDENGDELQAAWEADRARRDPVSRKLLKDRERLTEENAGLRALLNAEPAELTAEQVDALAAAGNRAVNDASHEDLCACDAWPEKCLSSGRYFQGYWDTGVLDTAMPAVISLWEVMRNGRDAAKVTELRAELVGLRAVVADAAVGNVAAAAEVRKLRTRVAELEAERSELNRMLRTVNARAADAFTQVAELKAAPLYLAEFDGMAPELHRTLDGAKEYIADGASADGHPWELFQEEDGSFQMVLTDPDTDRPRWEGPGRITPLRPVAPGPVAVADGIAPTQAPRENEAAAPDPLAYGPSGYRCGCGKNAHSNLVPCQDEAVEAPHPGPCRWPSSPDCVCGPNGGPRPLDALRSAFDQGEPCDADGNPLPPGGGS